MTNDARGKNLGLHVMRHVDQAGHVSLSLDSAQDDGWTWQCEYRSNAGGVNNLALICLFLAVTVSRQRLSCCPTSGPGRRLSCFFSSRLTRATSRSSASLAISCSVFLMSRRCTALVFSTSSYTVGSRPCTYTQPLKLTNASALSSLSASE